MKIDEKVSLTNHSTMGLGGLAAYLCTVTSRDEVKEAFLWAQQHTLPSIMIGDGSNIVWQDKGFPGLVLVNKILGYELSEEDADNIYLTVGAGEVWDQVVERSVASGLTGIEALSLIPGKTGATPVQNVGAYGQEIAETLTTIEALDASTGEFVTLPGFDCGFGYRTSRFKTTDRGRFFITSITLHLRRSNPLPPFYAAVQSYFEQNAVHDFTPQALREAVIAIRKAKLPDPKVVHNTGSFFGNPIVSKQQLWSLQQEYDPLPHWEVDNGVKLSAAWLIEQAGFKDFHDESTGMGTWPAQPLVLINEHANSTADLLAFKQKIIEAVETKFGITLTQEPELLP